MLGLSLLHPENVELLFLGINPAQGLDFMGLSLGIIQLP